MIDNSIAELLLKFSNAAYNTRIIDLMLSALALSLGDCRNEENIIVNIESHGREDIFENIDITNTVGWFTTQYPLLLHTVKDADIGSQIKSIKEQCRRVPRNGIGYGVWRYITQPENIDFYDPYISFNYFGEIDKSIYDFEKWSFDFENSGESVSEVNVQKKLLLDINGWQANNEMIFYFSYSEKVFSEDNITAIIECFVNYLEKIAVHCSNQKNVELTSSDYGFYKLSQEEFEEIISAYNDYTVQDIYPVAAIADGLIYNALKNPGSRSLFHSDEF